MLHEILVQVGTSSTGLDFSITQSPCGMQEHGCVYSVGMSTVKKSTFQLCHAHLSVYSCVPAWLPQNVFLWKLITGSYLIYVKKIGFWLTLGRNIGNSH